ncbi:MAG: hypothetical protein HQK79_04665 [Desulfobacterales bacterium]|nr:hypothetical protein [Desulfobacterales bacterium]
MEIKDPKEKYIEAVKALFTNFSDEEMDKYIEEEALMQEIENKINQTTDLEKIEVLLSELGDHMERSLFKEIRVTLAALNKKLADEEVDFLLFKAFQNKYTI